MGDLILLEKGNDHGSPQVLSNRLDISTNKFVPSSYSELRYRVDGCMVLVLLLAGGLILGEQTGSSSAGQSAREVTVGGCKVNFVSLVLLGGLLGAKNTGGLLGARDAGCC